MREVDDARALESEHQTETDERINGARTQPRHDELQDNRRRHDALRCKGGGTRSPALGAPILTSCTRSESRSRDAGRSAPERSAGRVPPYIACENCRCGAIW